MSNRLEPIDTIAPIDYQNVRDLLKHVQHGTVTKLVPRETLEMSRLNMNSLSKLTRKNLTEQLVDWLIEHDLAKFKAEPHEAGVKAECSIIVLTPQQLDTLHMIFKLLPGGKNEV